jgi:hypothetical protein
MARDDELTFRQFVSFVLGAEPSSALGQAVCEGWTATDHLLANMMEQHAGLISLDRRYPRPGLPEAPEPEQPQDPAAPPAPACGASAAVASGANFDTFDTPEDFENRMAAFRSQNPVSRTN